MASRLEIMSQVMLSLQVDQSKSMNNINSLIKNFDSEIDVVDKLKKEMNELSKIHSQMQECESFMLQIAESDLSLKKNNKEKNNIGSSGDFNSKNKDSEK